MTDVEISEIRRWFEGLITRAEVQARVDALLLAAVLEEARHGVRDPD